MKYLKAGFIFLLLATLLIALVYGWAIPASGLVGKTKGFSWGLGIELMALAFVWLFLVFLTSRLYATTWITLAVYLCFILVNLVKINFLDAPLMPIDFTQLDDLLRTTSVIIEYLLYLIIAVVPLIVLVVFLLKKEKPIRGLRYYALFILIVSSGLMTWQSNHISAYLKAEKLLILKNSNLVNRFTKHGYLNFFIQSIFFQTKPTKPEGYNKEQVNKILTKHDLDKSPAITPETEVPDNIIFILVESFVDPNELGWETSEVVVKHFNKLREKHISGKVVVPVFGGKSINTEFELLTGLSMFFTPIESLPFRELVSDHTPSIARVLSDWGFKSSVIQVVELSGFGFEKIYDYIGINQKMALTGDGIELDPSGRFASSQELFKQITAITAAEDKSFIYSFANSSHMPWHLEDYPESTLKLKHNHGISKHLQNKTLAYFNALRHVETLLTDLVAYYEKSEEKTLILFAGDHQPALDLIRDEHTKNHQKYVVPALIWSNYLPKQPAYDNFFVSMNYLSALTLKVAGLMPDGFFKFNTQAMDYINPLSSKYPTSKSPSVVQQQWLIDYEMLQYHILMDSNSQNTIKKQL
ncbi:MAG: LTA synthase family protein [Xanthomonadales bacterium]|nr:LTA synthase family protein [Xanthomonadales bacterium]